MRVLMFGWEFPPHISGGLGTACFGMTQALAKKGADIIFVLPRVEGSGGQNGFLRMRGASGTLVSPQVAESMAVAGQDLWASSIRCLPVESPLVPYLTPQGYTEALEYLRQGPQCTVTNRLVGQQQHRVLAPACSKRRRSPGLSTGSIRYTALPSTPSATSTMWRRMPMRPAPTRPGRPA